ncbi:MAG: hypothetical protein R6V12_03180 [Candidatus Hydrogenedentota bacterium]
MTPADNFFDEYGWDDEPLPRQERRRKAKSKQRFRFRDKESEEERPKKNFVRKPRQRRDWEDDYFDEG